MLTFISILFATLVAWGFDPPPLTGPVVDQAKVLSSADRQRLESQILRLRSERGVQAQILTLSSLDNQPIEMVSIRVVDQWKLGDKDRDDGVLILVAPNERKVRIEVGQGLEGDIPDVLAFQIIQQKILPEFKTGNYGKGLTSALSSIEALLSPETAVAARESFQGSAPSAKEGLIKFLIIFFIFIVLSTLGGPGGKVHASSFLAGVLLGSMRGGRGGFGGGGGWSGGGGGFSGGGASGGW